MEKSMNSTTLARTKSEQLVIETQAAATQTSKSPTMQNEDAPITSESMGTLSRKSSQRMVVGASPGRSSGGNKNNTHIRKARSAQVKMDVEELSNGAALSRASSASLGLSFSFTGFTVPPDEITDSKPFSDDDIPEDIEAGTCKPKFQTEPTLPIYLKFSDVTYKVITKGMTTSEERDILNGITGAVSPGEVLALMGPSGSGKTTLLNLLGGRLIQSTVGGSVTYNDQPYSKFLKSKIGFVTQDDVLFPHLTVKETLTYTARLRLSKALSRQQKEKRAIDVIYELGLERCQDTMIGGSFVRGVSGGERKRVCIGNEIIINPSLLFLDEPTSGLDSTTALRTVQTLQNIAEAGKTVITTIHQPSSRLFHKFDKLILLGKGSSLYFGRASEAMAYFSSIGCSPLIAMNPAEFLLDLANGNINDISVPSELEDKVQVGNSETETRNEKPPPAVIHESDSKSTRGRQDQAGLLFFIAVFWGFFPVFTAIFTFPQERAMLSKERAADMYRLSAYFLARTTSDLPLDLILPVLFLLVVYFMAGLRLSAGPFFLSMLTVFLCIIAAQGLGLAIGATLMDLKRATTLASVTVMTFMLAGGYFVKKVPVFISWIRYMSFNYHTYKLLLKVQYQDITPPVNGIKTDDGLWEVGALVAMIFGYRVLAYLSLRGMQLHRGA
ncbi:ABC transporter G family member 22 [Gossypium arboreum]|uniref:ABC transporter G family member 22 n=1 Tax=Gossypium arboreum TaxID=29729 RepID=A0A0B0Q3B6_GOSAR|nr:ABC transporter G family member 22 [Gossypium arboreum]